MLRNGPQPSFQESMPDQYSDCNRRATSSCPGVPGQNAGMNVCSASIRRGSLLLAKLQEPARRLRLQLQTSAGLCRTVCPYLQLTCVPQGQTQDQPGPRKNVPTTVKAMAVLRNQVITHQESGLSRSAPIKPAVALEK